MSGGTLEIKDNGQKIEAAQLLAEGLQDRFAFGCKTPKDEHALLPNGVNNITNFRVFEQQVNELCNLKIINRDFRLTSRCDDKVHLCGSFKLYIPCRDTVNRTLCQGSFAQVCFNEVGSAEVGIAEVGFVKVGSAEVGSVEVGIAEVGSVEVGIAEVGSAESGFAEVSSAEVSSPKITSVEVGVAEVGIAEVGSFETGSVEVGVAEVGSVEICFFEVGVAEVGLCI